MTGAAPQAVLDCPAGELSVGGGQPDQLGRLPAGPGHPDLLRHHPPPASLQAGEHPPVDDPRAEHDALAEDLRDPGQDGEQVGEPRL